MSNQGPIPIQVSLLLCLIASFTLRNQAVEPDTGNPPVPCRYVLIHIEEVRHKNKSCYSTVKFLQMNSREISGSQAINANRCMIPIEKKQIRLCLSNAPFLSEIEDFKELTKSKRFIHLARDILQREIHDLHGWDMVGYTYKIQPNPKPKSQRQSHTQVPYASMGGFTSASMNTGFNYGFGLGDRSNAEPDEEGELAMVVRIWGKGPSDQLFK
ncbi:hypothetical protein RhiJN_25142 [Ceratobasidium sp. AG-Ba]|nr:hypothetical protein RhiJN_25142 [Ceratobasidium sp. AG-Ba]